MKVRIIWGENLLGAETQEKSFKDEPTALEWLNKNHKRVQGINGVLTYGQRNLFAFMDGLRNDSE